MLQSDSSLGRAAPAMSAYEKYKNELPDEVECLEALLDVVWDIARDNHVGYRARVESIMAAIREKPGLMSGELATDTFRITRSRRILRQATRD